MPANKFSELFEELRDVFAGKGARIVDSVVPLAVFLLLRAFSLVDVSLPGAASAAVLLLLLRLFRHESPVYALGGLGAVGLAAVFIQVGGDSAGFFLPGLITGSITVLLCIISVAANRPLVAWTSHLTRRWPREWYWHRKVLPAYNEVTIVWGVVFALRLWMEFSLYQQGDVDSLGLVRLFLGWPFTVVLLIFTYLYGLWRLRNLGGPSVEEFKAGVEPPWESQRRGF
jgi:hypothetical protein